MQVIVNGPVLADSDDIVMVDGNNYFPRASVTQEFFRESDLTTVCGWQGTARCWDVVVEDQLISNAVWVTTLPSLAPSRSVNASPSTATKLWNCDNQF